MDELIKNLMPLLVASVAVQQLLELPEALLSLSSRYQKHKKPFVKLIAVAVGMIFAREGQFHILSIVGSRLNPFIDTLLAGLVVSAGTDCFNSIVKFLSYVKENKKGSGGG